MRNALVLSATVLALGIWGWRSAYGSLEAKKMHRIVIQVSSDDPKVWTLAMNNVDNIIAAVGKDHVDIKVVAYGPGLAMFKKDNAQMAKRLLTAKEMCPTGVQFNSCAVTMRKTGLTEKDLARYVETSPSGVVRVIELEEAGYTYLRP